MVRHRGESDLEFSRRKALQVAHDMIGRVTSDEQQPQEIDLSRVVNLRFSGMPFCGLRWFVSLPQALARTKMTDFGFRFFTTVGTSVHTVIQNAVALSKDYHALNDFVCQKCGDRQPLLITPPGRCAKCGSKHFRRDEHEVIWRGAIGHVDEIFVPDLSHRKRLFVMDYKTTSLSNINKVDPPGYVNQLRSYSVTLQEEGYEVLGAGLVYIPRDNPFKWRISHLPFTDQIFRLQRNRMAAWVRQHDQASAVDSLSELRELITSRPCRAKLKSYHADCPHRDFCAGNMEATPSYMSRLARTSYKEVEKWLPIANLKGLKKLPSS